MQDDDDEEQLKYGIGLFSYEDFSTITLVFLSSRNEYVNNGLCMQSFIKMNPFTSMEKEA